MGQQMNDRHLNSATLRYDEILRLFTSVMMNVCDCSVFADVSLEVCRRLAVPFAQ